MNSPGGATHPRCVSRGTGPCLNARNASPTAHAVGHDQPLSVRKIKVRSKKPWIDVLWNVEHLILTNIRAEVSGASHTA